MNSVSVASASVAPLPHPLGRWPGPTPRGLYSQSHMGSKLPGVQVPPPSASISYSQGPRLWKSSRHGGHWRFLGRDGQEASAWQCTVHVTSPEAPLACLSRKGVS